MKHGITGSILLGFGTLSSIAYRWADIEAYSVPIWQELLVFSLVIGGIILIADDLRDHYEG